MMGPDEQLNGYLADSIMKELSVETRVYMLSVAVQELQKRLGDLKKELHSTSIKLLVTLLGLVGVGFTGVLMVGSYKERIDTTVQTVQRLEHRSAEMAEKISALTAAIEAQNRR